MTATLTPLVATTAPGSRRSGRTTLRAELVPVPQGIRLWRDDQRWLEVQQPPHELVLRLTQGWSSLDGPVPGVAWARFADFLDQQGLVDAPSAAGGLAQSTVAVVGSGSVARRLALALARARVGGLLLHDPLLPTASSWSRSHEATRGHALAAWLRARAPQMAVRTRVVVSLDDLVGACRLVVVAPHTVEPDRVMLAQLVHRGLPHLVLRSHRGVARLGPLVVPGQAPCVGCQDLALAEGDPTRSLVLAHLVAHRAQCDELVTGELVARACREVDAFCRGEGGRLRAGVETIDSAAPGTQHTRLVWHQECHCQPGDQAASV